MQCRLVATKVAKKMVQSSFVSDFGIDTKKVFPVGAGINLSRILNVEGKAYDNPRILFVGKDFKRKGGEDLMNAFKLVRKEIENAELTIIGPHLGEVPKGVRSLGEISKLTSNGLDQLLNEYKRASVFVLPSLYEPFGIVFAEAMAHRLPCIGTRLCAMPEIIQNGETGFLVPPNDPKALAEKIVLLLKNPEQCRELGNKGYQHYAKNYTWQAVAMQICEIIDNEL